MLSFFDEAGDRMSIGILCIFKLYLHYLFQELPQALEWAGKAEAYLDNVRLDHRSGHLNPSGS